MGESIFMLSKVLFLFLPLCIGCGFGQSSNKLYKKFTLEKSLHEISGLVADGKDLWAITDKPKAVLYKLDSKGKVQQEIDVTNASASDVECVTADDTYVYMGDTGDNDGDRDNRQIIKVKKTAIGKEKNEKVQGELIRFTFSDEVKTDKKKKNNYDCEAILNLGDSTLPVYQKKNGPADRTFFYTKNTGRLCSYFVGCL